MIKHSGCLLIVVATGKEPALMNSHPCSILFCIELMKKDMFTMILSHIMYHVYIIYKTVSINILFPLLNPRRNWSNTLHKFSHNLSYQRWLQICMSCFWLVNPGKLTRNLKITQIEKENHLPKLPVHKWLRSEVPGSPIFMMQLCSGARHIEVQIVGDQLLGVFLEHESWSG